MNYIIAKAIKFLGLNGLFTSSRQQRREQALNELNQLEAKSSGIPAQSAALLSRITGMTDEDVIRELGSSPSGLTESEAAARLKQYGTNEVVHEQTVSWARQLFHAYNNPFNILITVLAVVSYFTEDIKATVILSAMVILSSLLRFVQEFRSTRAAEKLQAMVRTTATVKRIDDLREEAEDYAGMVETVQVAVLQHLFAGIAVHVQMLFEHDPALRKGAGLVGAQHVHRPEVLNGVQTFDDHLLARHCQRALGQVDRHDHGQHLRGQPDSHRHGKQERLQPVVLGEAVDEEHRGNHHGDKVNHQPGELVDALVEAGQLALPDDTGGQRSKVGPVPGVDDHGGRGPAFNVGAQEADIGKFQRVLNVCRCRSSFLFQWQGFAGESRLIQKQVFGG